MRSQTTGITFFDHTQDALDFALSRSDERYWRNDGPGAQVDLAGDGGDLRAGCSALRGGSTDDYSYVGIATSPDQRP